MKESTERHAAVVECVRVCKPAGLIILAYIIAQAQPNNPYDDIFFATTPSEIEAIATKHKLEKIHNISRMEENKSEKYSFVRKHGFY